MQAYCFRFHFIFVTEIIFVKMVVWRSAFTVVKNDSAKSIGPSVTEADWFWLVPHMADSSTVGEVRSMSVAVKTAIFGV